MGFADAVKSALGQYTGFSGRARRSEYWWFILALVVAGMAAALVDAVAQTAPLFYALVGLGAFLPALAVTVRRLHDTGRPGWWILVGLVPFVGGIVLLVFYCSDSTADNKYGPSPKQASAELGNDGLGREQQTSTT